MKGVVFMDKCSSYHTQFKIEYKLKSHTSISELFNPTFHEEIKKEVGVCFGTKECEECSCGGDRTKCDFYPEVRLKAVKEMIVNSLYDKINNAFQLLIENGYERNNNGK